MRPPLCAIIGATALTLGPVSVHAQDTAQVKRAEFSADLGFVNASGNASVTTFNVGDKLVLRSRDSTHILTQLFGLVCGRSDGPS